MGSGLGLWSGVEGMGKRLRGEEDGVEGGIVKRRKIELFASVAEDEAAEEPERLHDAHETGSAISTTRTAQNATRTNAPDRLSALSDEVLIRILHHLPVKTVLLVQSLSRNFQRLAGDAQVWKGLYYGRFVRGRRRKGRARGDETGKGIETGSGRHWKARYRLRHNWATGSADVKEISVGIGVEKQKKNNLGVCIMARLVDGAIITVAVTDGLRAWDLSTKDCIAHCPLSQDLPKDHTAELVPTCLGVDTSSEDEDGTSIVVGFHDGTFRIWKFRHGFDEEEASFEWVYESSVKEIGHVARLMGLYAVAYRYPYLLTVTVGRLLAVYVFDQKNPKTTQPSTSDKTTLLDQSTDPSQLQPTPLESNPPHPRLLASLRSHTASAPLSLSIRTTPHSIIAAIAYTQPTYFYSFTVGLQELHFNPSGDIIREHIASASAPNFQSEHFTQSNTLSLSSFSARSRSDRLGDRTNYPRVPTSLSYTHPYLLTSNADNTLGLYLVTSTEDQLSISPRTTLWGHTSSVAVAQVGSRGKAVSVALGAGFGVGSAGAGSGAWVGEVRVWDLEGGGVGRKGLERVGGSVVVRSKESEVFQEADGTRPREEDHGGRMKKGWVGFNEEVVVVVKDGHVRSGKLDLALVVYDFS